MTLRQTLATAALGAAALGLWAARILLVAPAESPSLPPTVATERSSICAIDDASPTLERLAFFDPPTRTEETEIPPHETVVATSRPALLPASAEETLVPYAAAPRVNGSEGPLASDDSLKFRENLYDYAPWLLDDAVRIHLDGVERDWVAPLGDAATRRESHPELPEWAPLREELREALSVHGELRRIAVGSSIAIQNLPKDGTEALEERSRLAALRDRARADAAAIGANIDGALAPFIRAIESR